MNRLVRLCTDTLLVSVALSYLAGASCAFWLNRPLAELPITAIGLALMAGCLLLAVVLGNRFRPLATLPFFMLVGLLHTHGALQPITDPHHLATLISRPVKTTLVGRIATMAENNGERTRFELDCEALLLHDPTRQATFQPARGTVLLSIRGTIDPEFVPGTKIMVMATVDRIRNYQTPGVFDYRLQMAVRSILCTGWIQSPQEIRSVADPWDNDWQAISYQPEQIRQKTADFLMSHLPSDIAGLYQALLIGSVVNIPSSIMEAFKENGCFHILSISGLHFSLLGFFCVGVFTFLLKRSTWLLLHTHVPTLALILTAPILLLYTFIAGFNIPAIRSLITALLVLYAVVLRRQQTLIHLIAAAALIVLAFNPLALFTPSFQLSFAAVLAINLIYPRLPVFAGTAPASPSGKISWLQAVRIVQSMLYVSLAATLGTLPFLLYHFNRVSLIGPVMNLFIEPLLCLWALPCGLLAVPMIPLAPEVAKLLLQAGQPGIGLALWLTDAVAGLPYASLWTATPHPVEVIVFICILVLWLLPRPTVARRTVACGLALLLTGSFTYPLWSAKKERELTVSYLDVGQGAATLVQLPDGTDILIDGGGYQSEQFDTGQNLIGPFLWHKRIWRLHDLIITHPHLDHYSGLPFITERFRPRRVIVNGEAGEDSSYASLLHLAEQKGATLHTAHSGELIHRGHDFTFTCLGMNGLPIINAPPLTTNDRSLVFRLQSGEHSFLFPADIGLASEHLLIRNNLNLRADVLLAPHHGSLSSTGQTFLEQVNPKLIVVSASQRRRGFLPAPEHLQQWHQKKIPVLVTGQDGTINCISDGKTLSANAFSGVTYHFGR
jgi:competence protein ComEC